VSMGEEFGTGSCPISLASCRLAVECLGIKDEMNPVTGEWTTRPTGG